MRKECGGETVLNKFVVGITVSFDGHTSAISIKSSKNLGVKRKVSDKG